MSNLNGSPESKVVSAPVESVTLLEDRGVVTRRAKLQLEKGRTRVRVDGVAPVLANKTLAARVGGEARIHDVRVRREPRVVAASKTEEHRKLEEEIEELESNIARLERRDQALRRQGEMVSDTETTAMTEIAADAAWNRLDAAGWDASLDKLVAARVAAVKESVSIARDGTEAREALSHKRARLAAISTPLAELLTWIEIDVEAAAETAGDLVLSYVVPGALWRPQHTATLTSKAVRFECEGVIWQNTGEDWIDVDVVLSTERPSLGANPPLLATDVLDVVPKSQAIVVEARDQTVEETRAAGGEGGGPPPTGMPGIDDGGEARKLTAKGKQTIRSDGRPHRVSLFSFEHETKIDLVAMPEIVSAVIEKTELVNKASQPILAGPVDLVKSGGPYGKTNVLYVAPNERFALGWGPDPGMRVRRTIEQLPEESTLLGGWTTRTEDIEVRVSNLTGEKKSITVKERVGVSEIEKVQIAVLEKDTTERKTPDANGFLTWNLTIEPHGRAKVKLRVSTKKHSDVVG